MDSRPRERSTVASDRIGGKNSCHPLPIPKDRNWRQDPDARRIAPILHTPERKRPQLRRRDLAAENQKVYKSLPIHGGSLRGSHSSPPQGQPASFASRPCEADRSTETAAPLA